MYNRNDKCITVSLKNTKGTKQFGDLSINGITVLKLIFEKHVKIWTGFN
jgi:hypothetical protein